MKRLKVTIFLALLAFYPALVAYDANESGDSWVFRAGTTGDDEGYSITVDPSGNIIVLGP